MSSKRRYDLEYQREGPARKQARAARNRARRAMYNKLKDQHGAAKAQEMLNGAHVDHIKHLSEGGTNAPSNLRLRDKKKNISDKSMFKGKRTTRPEVRKKTKKK